ncbi:MAG: UDP-N-acetylmuramate--L-alanine ligase [Pseudomonadota bacterium]
MNLPDNGILTAVPPARVHLIGIGGAGMSGIAQVLLSRNHPVTGSDLQPNAATERLIAQGASIYTGHHADNLGEVDIVVISSAVADDNPEVLAAKARQIPVLLRAQMLAELMRDNFSITIAGSHGKTTASALASSLLLDAGLAPTYVLGGTLNATGCNAQQGDKPDYLIAEADESDGSFVHLFPTLAVVTSLDPDHMGTYGGDVTRLRSAFLRFLHKLPDDGIAHLCLDHPAVRELIPDIRHKVISYGFADDATVRACEYRQQGHISQFQVVTPEHSPFRVQIPLPGRHNVQNALAAISIGLQLQIDIAVIQASLRGFQGIGRRFNTRQCSLPQGDIIWIDDYAHHPAELSATLATIRDGWPERRLLVAYQPHRYTRTHDLFDEQIALLADIEHLVLCDIYAAGEAPIKGAGGTDLYAAIAATAQGTAPTYVDQIADLPHILRDLIQADDIVLTVGAGNIGQVARTLFNNHV